MWLYILHFNIADSFRLVSESNVGLSNTGEQFDPWASNSSNHICMYKISNTVIPQTFILVNLNKTHHIKC